MFAFIQKCRRPPETNHEVIIGAPSKGSANNKLNTTKYNAFDFVPRFLVAKFLEPTNAFFLVLTLVKLLPEVSAVPWHSSGVPLIIIILVNAFTEIYEDLIRRFADTRLNNTEVEVFDGASETWIRTQWKMLEEGHIVRLTKGDMVPADLLILSSSEPGGDVYMETANLDGEANLKVRQAPAETMGVHSEERVKTFFESAPMVTCEPPSRALDHFQGVLKLSPHLIADLKEEQSQPRFSQTERQDVSISGANFVIRGATLRNTDWVLGAVIYAGKNTKIAQNSVKKSTKMSRVHRLTNWMVLTQIGWLLLLAMGYAWAGQMQARPGAQPHPLRSPEARLPRLGDTGEWMYTWLDKEDRYIHQGLLRAFLGQLILFSNLVPISLCVTIEGCLMWQAYFIKQDIGIYDEERDQKSEVRSFAMIPNLGLVKYVMSDKTGTLTTNRMNFKFCSIGGKSYGVASESPEFDGRKMVRELRTNNKGNAEAIDNFLTACAVCHTVVAERDRRPSTPRPGETSISVRSSRRSTKEPQWHACSPDEGCLVRFARDCRYTFKTRTPDTITIDADGESRTYTILALIEFTSARKRMGCLVRTPQGRLKFFIKGADAKILPTLSRASDPEIEKMTKEHLKNFANLGYRTLCFGYRDVTEEEYLTWADEWNKANCDLENREKMIEEVAAKMEHEILLLGASAIEDKLQDRVPETIARMLQAEMKVWVLTGDKLETAINIGHSCSLLSQDTPKIILDRNTEAETEALLDSYVGMVGERMLDAKNAQLALIVDAQCLDWVMGSSTMRMDFLRIALCCSAVICCRCTPFQKAAVTRLVRNNVDGLVLSVGDGANDVAMIQEADIGVGITGVEGSQAANASDFAISQFHHLDRLLFVHGTTCFHRISTVVLFSLYKNLIEVSLNMFYGFDNGNSDNPVADESTMVRYNLIYTCWIVGILGIFDNPVPLDVLGKYPLLYTHFQDNLTNLSHMIWSANAMLHGAMLYYAYRIWWRDGGVMFPSGRDGWGQMGGSWLYSCMVFVVSLKSVLESLSITVLTALGCLSSIIGVAAMMVVDSYLFPYFIAPIIGPNRAHYLGLIYTLPSPQTGLFLLFICAACLLPDLAVKALYRTLYPSILHRVIQSLAKKDTVLDTFRQPMILLADVVGLKQELESGKYGFMFAQDDGRVISQGDLLKMYGAPDCRSSRRQNQNKPAAEHHLVEQSPVSSTKSLNSRNPRHVKWASHPTAEPIITEEPVVAKPNDEHKSSPSCEDTQVATMELPPGVDGP